MQAYLRNSSLEVKIFYGTCRSAHCRYGNDLDIRSGSILAEVENDLQVVLLISNDWRL